MVLAAACSGWYRGLLPRVCDSIDDVLAEQKFIGFDEQTRIFFFRQRCSLVHLTAPLIIKLKIGTFCPRVPVVRHVQYKVRSALKYSTWQPCGVSPMRKSASLTHDHTAATTGRRRRRCHICRVCERDDVDADHQLMPRRSLSAATTTRAGHACLLAAAARAQCWWRRWGNDLVRFNFSTPAIHVVLLLVATTRPLRCA